MIDQMEEKATEIAANQKFRFLERLTAVILAFNSNTELGYEVMLEMHKPQNALIPENAGPKLF